MYRDSAPGSIARGPQRVEGIGEGDWGKANHSDPYIQPPRGGCIICVDGQGCAQLMLSPCSLSPGEASCKSYPESSTPLCDAYK